MSTANNDAAIVAYTAGAENFLKSLSELLDLSLAMEESNSLKIVGGKLEVGDRTPLEDDEDVAMSMTAAEIRGYTKGLTQIAEWIGGYGRTVAEQSSAVPSTEPA